MQKAEESNVVQIRDYASRRTSAEASDRANTAGQYGQLLAWPRMSAPYPGGIDDLPF